jgi:DNA polymerase-3 subunit delta'
MIYPWQEEAWAQLRELPVLGRLPHALLFRGLPGIGKNTLAIAFIRSLICDKELVPLASACCHPCRMLNANTHPNVLTVAPEGKSQTIKIEQIRAAIDFVSQTSLSGIYRFVLINQADKMNINAANALLKTLEEPSSFAMLLLVADQLGRLPATIISRCQQVHCKTPDKSTALRWLKEKLSARSEKKIDHDYLLNISHGAPLQATNWADDKRLALRNDIVTALTGFEKNIGICSEWSDADIKTVLELFLSVAIDILRIQLGADAMYLYHSDYMDPLQNMAAKLNKQAVVTYLERIKWYNQQLLAGMNLNKQLVLENLLIEWFGLTRGN